MSEKISLAGFTLDVLPEAKDLPGDLQGVADVIGVRDTIKLALAYRGCSIYICNIDHILRRQRNTKIRNAYDQGEKVVSLARKFRLSTRQIERILSTPD